MQARTRSWKRPLLDALDPAEPWSLIERFTSLVRESSSEDERSAFDYLAGRLSALGIPHTMHMPELFLSVPVRASLAVGDRSFRAKTPAFSISTPPEGESAANVCASKASRPGAAPTSLTLRPSAMSMSAARSSWSMALAGPPPVWYFQNQGAKGCIFINPGVDIHWGICTTIWGAPDLDNYHRQPDIPVVSINRPDGDALMAKMAAGAVNATLHAKLKEGWFECPCLVAEIKGNIEPERFALVHGHVDSWDVGIGDNAVGNASLLELARIFHDNREGLSRTLRVAWWSGHSTGRYGASTWYADQFGLDLARNCIAQMNIDSPGCRWATEYRGVTVMSEGA